MWKPGFSTKAHVFFPTLPVTPDEGPLLETSKFSLYFPGNCIPTNYESLHVITLGTTYTGTDTSRLGKLSKEIKGRCNLAKGE
jgi:hypothetical protein